MVMTSPLAGHCATSRSPRRFCRLLWRTVFAVLGAGLFATQVFAAPHPALAPIEQMLAAGKPGVDVVKALEALPLDVRKTADYHWVLARAHHSADEPALAAEALAVLKYMDPQTPRDTKAIQDWLEGKAASLFAAALDAYHKGDMPHAAECYVKAIRCDLKVLAKPEEGLGERILSLAARKADVGPKKPLYFYGLGFCNYRYNHLRAAKAAFEEFIRRNPDVYWQWKAKHWIDRLDAEIVVSAKARQDQAVADQQAKQQAEEEQARQDQAQAADRAAMDQAAAKAQAVDRQRQLIDLDARIRDAENRLETAVKMTQGQVVVDESGHASVLAVNQRAVKAQIVELARQLEDLKAQRDDLQRAPR
ncbi:MAG: hypothetical protein HY815_28125 [Candidatus Riflebacteria bacterium]|nr:hypothetical protein [Candidatus Riflebacteria bacterium]